MLDFVLVKEDYRYYAKVKHLFEHAFPPIERPSFSMLMQFKNHEMYSVEYNSTFVGLVDLVIYKDLVYIFFLAVKKTFRNKHIGSSILKDISNKYRKSRLFLLAEDPNIECNNKEERLNRIGFYNKNGFILSDIRINEYEVDYRVLYKNNIVTKEDFLKVMEYLLGKEWFNNYYINNVK